jgi:hypothetical protein
MFYIENVFIEDRPIKQLLAQLISAYVHCIETTNYFFLVFS